MYYFISQFDQARETLGELIAVEAERKFKNAKVTTIQANFHHLPLARIRRDWLNKLAKWGISLATATASLLPTPMELPYLPSCVIPYLKKRSQKKSPAIKMNVVVNSLIVDDDNDDDGGEEKALGGRKGRKRPLLLLPSFIKGMYDSLITLAANKLLQTCEPTEKELQRGLCLVFQSLSKVTAFYGVESVRLNLTEMDGAKLDFLKLYELELKQFLNEQQEKVESIFLVPSAEQEEEETEEVGNDPGVDQTDVTLTSPEPTSH
jgi:hypothetical protein